MASPHVKEGNVRAGQRCSLQILRLEEHVVQHDDPKVKVVAECRW